MAKDAAGRKDDAVRREEPSELAEIEAEKQAIEQAKQCDTDAAEKFAKVAGESADTIALAAFEKCVAQWQEAENRRPHGHGGVPFTQEQMKENPFLLSTWLEKVVTDGSRDNFEARKASEVSRLRLVIIEQRAQ